MSKQLIRLSVLIFSLSFSALADAEQPEKSMPSAPEQLGTPREVLPEALPREGSNLYPGYFRTSRYDVWQYYGVDRFGRFRPRVIYSPFGSYYLYNGEPFPWVSVHSLDIMPYVVD